MQFEEILGGFTFLEAPRVDAAGNLYFSEVMKGGVWRLSPDGKLDSFTTFRKFIGGLALTANGGIITSGHDGLLYTDLATGDHQIFIAHADGDRIIHVNDIQADDHGDLYIGGTRQADFGKGPFPSQTALYRVDFSRLEQPGGALRFPAKKLWGGFEISNGIGFSPDRARLYFSETFAGIAIFDLGADGTLSNKRFLTEFRGSDGLTVDAEGGVWVADYARGRVLRFLPDGTLEREFDFSTRFDGCRVTSLIFGGPDLKTLYVVTACDYQNLTDGAGRVYRAASDVAGQPTPLVRFRWL